VKQYIKIIICLSSFALFCCLSTAARSQTRTKPLPNTVTLTFDDGPNPRDTPRILNILKHYHIHAVFFVTTRLAKIYPSIVRRIAAEGNVVANHTITHPKLTRLSNARLSREISDSKRTLTKILGYSPICFRPPFFSHQSPRTSHDQC